MGYKMAARVVRREGWHVNRKRIQRLWRDEGLKRPPQRARKRRRVRLDSSERLRALRPNQSGDQRRKVGNCIPQLGIEIRDPGERQRHGYRRAAVSAADHGSACCSVLTIVHPLAPVCASRESRSVATTDCPSDAVRARAPSGS